MEKIWTKEEITSLLKRNDKAVIRGLLAIYKLQTIDEKTTKTTNHHNNIGFNGVDAKILSDYVEKYEKYGKLSERQMILLKKRIMKYAGQLTKIANGKIIVGE